MVCTLHDLMSLNFTWLTLIAICRCQCLKFQLFKMCTIQTKNFSSLTRGSVQRRNVRLPLLGALSLSRPRYQWAVGGCSPDCEGRLCGPRVDRRGPRSGTQGEPDQPGQTLPSRAGTAIIWQRPGPGSGPLQGDEPPPGQQDPPSEVPLLSWPQCTVTHTHAYTQAKRHSHTCIHTPDWKIRGRGSVKDGDGKAGIREDREKMTKLRDKKEMEDSHW